MMIFPVELLKAESLEAFALLTQICNDCYKMENVPVDWQKGVICPIFKKGDNTLCAKHREITLLSHALSFTQECLRVG